jgi:hypothetical protein
MPGIGVFQATFSFASPFHLVGTPVSWLEPSPRGPRHPGQFSAAAGEMAIKNAKSKQDNE